MSLIFFLKRKIFFRNPRSRREVFCFFQRKLLAFSSGLQSPSCPFFSGAEADSKKRWSRSLLKVERSDSGVMFVVEYKENINKERSTRRMKGEDDDEIMGRQVRWQRRRKQGGWQSEGKKPRLGDRRRRSPIEERQTTSRRRKKITSRRRKTNDVQTEKEDV